MIAMFATATLVTVMPAAGHQGAVLSASTGSRLDADFDTFVPPPYISGSLEVEREIIDLRILARDARTPRILELIEDEARHATRVRLIFKDTGILPPAEQYPALWKYLRAIEDEVDFFSARDMIRFGRLWPADVSENVSEIAGRADVAPYPSGVSARAYALAYGLSIVNPNCSGRYFETSMRISKRREIAGLNYASDTSAGEVLASRVVEALVTGGALSGLIAAVQDEMDLLKAPSCDRDFRPARR